jgi:hypothetical protein
MSTSRRWALIPVALLVVAACGDDDASDSVDTLAPTTVAETTTTVTTVPVDTVVDTVAESTIPPTAPDGPVQIDVIVGVDSSPDRIETVKVGESVTVNITNPNHHDEYHIHGVDLEQKVDAGVMATFNFVALTPGSFEVESHDTEDVLFVLVVEG